MPYQDYVDDGFGSPGFMRAKLEGLIKYIIEQYKLADEKNPITGKPIIDGYVNRQIYRRLLYNERFELKPETEKTNLLSDVALKKGCKGAFTDWYRETIREYRIFRIDALYGISLIEYIFLPSYIQEVMLEDAKEVKRQEPKGSDAMLRELSKNPMYSEEDLKKLRI